MITHLERLHFICAYNTVQLLQPCSIGPQYRHTSSLYVLNISTTRIHLQIFGYQSQQVHDVHCLNANNLICMEDLPLWLCVGTSRSLRCTSLNRPQMKRKKGTKSVSYLLWLSLFVYVWCMHILVSFITFFIQCTLDFSRYPFSNELTKDSPMARP